MPSTEYHFKSAPKSMTKLFDWYSIITLSLTKIDI